MVQKILSIIRRMGIYDTKFIMWIRSIVLRYVGKNLRKHGSETLAKFKSCVEELKIEYWLDFGTLLGIYRDGRLMDHDADIDIAVFDNEKKVMLEEVLKKSGFKKVREFWIGDILVEQTYNYKGVQVDIFYYFKNSNKNIYCYTFYCDTKLVKIKNDNGKFLEGWKTKRITSKIEGFSEIEFNNICYSVPKNIEEYLSTNYGANFKIKDKYWNPDKAPNVQNIEVEQIKCVLFK